MTDSDGALESTSKTTAIDPADVDMPSKLHALIERSGGKKTWEAESSKAAEEILTAALFSTSSMHSELGNILSLAQDLPVSIIESLFKENWPKLSAGRRDEIVSELFKIGSEKSQTRQAAIAERIAQTDPRNAAYIVYGLMCRGKKSKEGDFWPQLSKEKRELLRGRFGTRQWVYFNVPDESVMRVLLAGFVEVMTASQVGAGKKTQRPMYDFARWALATLKRVSVNSADRERVVKQLVEVTKNLPVEWKDQLASLAAELGSSEDHRSATPSTSDQNTTHLGGVNTDVLVDHTSTKPGQIPQTVASHSPSSPSIGVTSEARPRLSASRTEIESAALALIKRKHAEVKDRRASIELLQNDVHSVESEANLIHRILQEMKNSEAAKNGVETSLKEMELKTDGLQSVIGRLENDLASTRTALGAAEERSRSLEIDKTEMRQALDDERRARANERQELEDEIERSAAVKLNGFKARLANSLRQIFRDKKRTDDQEPSSHLSEFLRTWFDEAEEKLVELGVDLRKDV